MIEELRLTGKHVIFALDVPSKIAAFRYVRMLAPYVWGFKVGSELAEAVGAPWAVELIRDYGGKVFRDGKYDDIPETVRGAVRANVRLGVHAFSVHVREDNAESLRFAAEESKDALALGVTVLTSVAGQVTGTVLRRAGMALDAGLDGLIASAQEVRAIRSAPGLRNLIIVTPGIRLAGFPNDNTLDYQRRTATPDEAIRAGANLLVVGRPIRDFPNEHGGPLEALRIIGRHITQAKERSIP